MTTHDYQETELERKLRAEVEAEEESHGAAPAGDPEQPPVPSAAEPDDTPAGTEYENLAPDTIDTLAALEDQVEDLKNQLLRQRAEFENYRKRTAREVERFRKTATETVIHDMLPVLDNLELALSHAEGSAGPIAQGVSMVLNQLIEVLERSGLECIEALGQPFDPNVHEAVSQIESDDVPKDNVAQEIQRGYKLGGQILRPAKVVVSVGATEAKPSK